MPPGSLKGKLEKGEGELEYLRQEYAGWSPETPPGFSVSPIQGRMERRGGEPSLFDIEVKADGQTGEKVGYLCIVLPDDDEQFTIKVTVNCF